MIIAFDGNVFVGKTTLIKNICRGRNYNIIPEYSEYMVKGKTGRSSIDSHTENQLKYLSVDKRRKKNLRRGVNLLDRSFISTSAHVLALYKLKIVDMRKSYLKELARILTKREIIIPDKYIYVSCVYTLAKKRYIMDCKKKTEPIYINKKYFYQIKRFNERWLKMTGGVTINGNKNISSKTINGILSINKNYSLSAKKIIKIISKLLEIRF